MPTLKAGVLIMYTISGVVVVVSDTCFRFRLD